MALESGPLKITSATKHRNTTKKIIIYTHRVYSLLSKLEKNKVSYSYFHFYTCSPWHADFVFNSYLIERLCKYGGCDADMKIKQNFENLFMTKF